MNIALDIDEVLAELLEAFIQYHNSTYGTDATKKDFFSYNYWEVLGGTKEDMIKKVIEFYDTSYFQEIKPVSGAQEVTSRLAQQHQLTVITARQTIITAETEKWLDRYFPQCFSSINFTNQWCSKGKARLKSSVGVEKDIELMVEDSLMHAYDCAAAGITVLLMDMDYGWNQTTERLPSNITRVHSWEQIEEEIERYGRERHRNIGR